MASISLPQVFAAATALAQEGKLLEAEQLCQQILAHHSDDVDTLNLRGALLAQLKRHDEAIRLLEQAVSLRPTMPEVFYNLGNVLKDAGQLDKAVVAFRKAIDLRPGFPQACNNLGNVFLAQKQYESAAAAYLQAIAGRPGYAQAHCNLGSAFRALGDVKQAASSYNRAIELRPDYAEAHSNLSSVLVEMGRLEGAVESARKAIALDPRLPEPHCNLGNALRAKGEEDAAMAAFGEALHANPDYAKAKWNISWSLLLKGEFEKAWPLYEARWETEEFGPKDCGLRQPIWGGSDISGKTILLHCEQGLGDTLQFVRYAQLVKARGAHVIMQCPPTLKRLLQKCPGVDRVISTDDLFPPFDMHIPLLSLPGIFGTTLQSVPADVPYLFPDPMAKEHWRAQLAGHRTGSKIGLVWAGSPKNPRDRERSLHLADFAPLSRLADGPFYSLQKGEPARQALQPPAGIMLVDWTSELHDFADTAALLANLDLLITCDTSMAHLAGAMGKPVWVLLPFSPDWRWLLGRTDSPWYPTMKLFRQPKLGDWKSAIEEMMNAE